MGGKKKYQPITKREKIDGRTLIELLLFVSFLGIATWFFMEMYTRFSWVGAIAAIIISIMIALIYFYYLLKCAFMLLGLGDKENEKDER